MRTRLKRGESDPLYRQITADIEARIARGEWSDGAPLPSENELVRKLGVSRMTIHRALRELSERGVLSRVRGVGTFVAPPAARSELLEIRDIAEDIAGRGHEHRAEVIELDALRADRELAEALAARVGARVFHSVIVHFENDAPLQLEERFISPAFAPDYLKQDFTRTTPTAYLQRVGQAAEIEQTIFAAPATPRVQSLLRTPPKAPCLVLVRRTWRNGAPVTRSIFTAPGDRYSLSSRYAVGRFGRV